VITPPADIAWQLRLSSGSDQVSCLSRLRLADELPVAIETAYLPLSLCPNLLSHDFRLNRFTASWRITTVCG
jgi:DNA-binding GntR family transcriptional regulator